MKRWLFIAVVALLPHTGLAAEHIANFVSDITIDPGGSFVVTEIITYDFDATLKHGIFRTIPLTHPQPASSWYKKRYIDVSVESVTLDRGDVPYELSSGSDELEIKIGDPNVTISGEHVYTIVYEVRGALQYLDDGTTELYWNVTGTEWPVPMTGATAVVRAPIGALHDTRSCYVGGVGDTSSCKSITASSSEQVTFISHQMLPGEGMTIAQELDSDVVGTQILERTPTWWMWLIGGLAWLLVLGRFVYGYRTEYKPDVAVVSQYEPYEDMKPMFSGVLIDGQLNARDISAGLVYLAEQGFLTITKTSRKVLLVFETDDYDVTLKRPASEVETEFLRTVLGLLFDGAAAVGTTVALSELRTDTSKQRANQKALAELRKAVIEDLIERGYFERLLSVPVLILVAVTAVSLFIFVVPILAMYIGAVAAPLALIVIGSVIILGFMYQRRTRKGYEALNHLKGFKEFLSVTDRERFDFHNAPEKSPQQFMEYLPYAIAFGVEEKWAEVFKDVALPNPDWYQGNTGTTFSAVALSRDLGAFTNSFTTSSGSSASSGGGSVGGGAGGGGGGSW
ncbi:DUF2207 domain-containing protein [Candidatus Kaiserbacteria bacterium]|nr:DUF2207 domain-containing protein [Candidatus Kaiserbacteria bacterium]